MKRAALYARFSTDLQSDRSIADQLSLCRDYLRRAGGFEIAASFSDSAISGASIENRPGIKELMQRVWTGDLDAVIAESTYDGYRFLRLVDDMGTTQAGIRYCARLICHHLLLDGDDLCFSPTGITTE